MKRRTAIVFRLARLTLYNVCSIHWGMFSTSGSVQYIGGMSSVHQGMFSTSEKFMIHVGDIMSTLGHVQYIGGIP